MPRMKISFLLQQTIVCIIVGFTLICELKSEQQQSVLCVSCEKTPATNVSELSNKQV
jgi:hypothetical protein